MASDVRVVIHSNGVGDVFRSGGVVGKLEEMGEAIKNEANSRMVELYPDNRFQDEHFEMHQYKTSYGNVGVSVGTNTYLARVAQARHSVLTQAMDAGRV